MNWFGMGTAVLNACAGVKCALSGDYMMAGVWACYAVAAFLLSLVH